MAAEPKADRNPASPDSPYATVNMTWAGNNPVNPWGDPGAADSESVGNAHFSPNQGLPSASLAGSDIPVRPPV